MMMMLMVAFFASVFSSLANADTNIYHLPPDQRLVAGVMSLDVVAVKSALRDGADPNVNTGVFGRVINIAAASSPHITKILVDAGADVNVASGLRSLTPLAAAANEGKYDSAKILLDAGADPAAVDGVGRQPWSRALESGNVELYRFLLAETPPNKIRCSDPSHLFFAGITLDDPAIARKALEDGADLRGAVLGEVPLGIVALSGFNPKIAEITCSFLKNGAAEKFKWKVNSGRTTVEMKPLVYVLMSASGETDDLVETVRVLKKYGATLEDESVLYEINYVTREKEVYDRATAGKLVEMKGFARVARLFAEE